MPPLLLSIINNVVRIRTIGDLSARNCEVALERFIPLMGATGAAKMNENEGAASSSAKQKRGYKMWLCGLFSGTLAAGLFNPYDRH